MRLLLFCVCFFCSGFVRFCVYSDLFLFNIFFSPDRDLVLVWLGLLARSVSLIMMMMLLMLLLRLLLYVVRNKPPLRNFSTGLIPAMINYVGRGWLVMDGLNVFVRFYFKMLLIAAEKQFLFLFAQIDGQTKTKIRHSCY